VADHVAVQDLGLTGLCWAVGIYGAYGAYGAYGPGAHDVVLVLHRNLEELEKKRV
jgi:hypothetical protein